jgi:hypothetical protein
MSAPRIIAQSTPALLVSFPNWKQPTLCGVRFTIAGGAGVATVISTESDQGDAPSTPHWTIARAAAGIYDVLFPAVRRWAPSTLACPFKTVAVNGTFATTDLRPPVIDRSPTNTNPRGVLLNGNLATGRIRVGFFTNAGAIPAELADNLEGNLSLWVDYGS